MLNPVATSFRPLCALLAFMSCSSINASGQADDQKKANDANDVSVLNYEGYAYLANDHSLLAYVEKHTLTRQKNQPIKRSVQYIAKRDPTEQGTLIAQKENRYGASHLTSSQAAEQPTFHLKDFRTGYEERVDWKNNELEMSVRDTDVWTKKITSAPEGTVIDAGFDEFVRRHWDDLLKGEQKPFQFAVPSRFGFVAFKIERTFPDRDPQTDPYYQRQTVSLSMTLASRWLAWLLDPITLTYDRSTKRLLRYEGLSNIRDTRDGADKNYDVDIRYVYPKDTE